MTSRRALLRTAAWAAPTAIVAVAAPAIAASTLKGGLRFNNITANVGKKKRVVYANTMVSTTGGDPVPGLVVTVSVDGDSRASEHSLSGWGNTEKLEYEFHNRPLDSPTVVHFYAEAPGYAPISGEVTVHPPKDWWK